jgi:predicted metal-dependent hydrolase
VVPPERYSALALAPASLRLALHVTGSFSEETPMLKRLTITVPHDLGAAEVRRRIDSHMDWAVQRLATDKVQVEAEERFGNPTRVLRKRLRPDGERRDSAGRGRAARRGAGAVDDRHVSTRHEAVGRHYGSRLLSEDGASRNKVH